METQHPANEQCLTRDEQRELQEQWTALQASLEPLGTRINGGEGVDCDELYALFLQLGDAFEAFEHSLMRCKQVRMLHSSHASHTT
jgi:hypothetical protein